MLAETRYEHIILNDVRVPVIEGTTMKVVQLVLAQAAYGWSVEELREQFPYLTFGQIYSALAYYWDHQVDLDADIEGGAQGGRHPKIHSRIAFGETIERKGAYLMPVSLYMDHHVPKAITTALRLRGVDVMTSCEEGTDRLDDEKTATIFSIIGYQTGMDMPADKRPLKVFLCHAHTDCDAVRALYTRLINDGVDVSHVSQNPFQSVHPL